MIATLRELKSHLLLRGTYGRKVKKINQKSFIQAQTKQKTALVKFKKTTLL